MYQFPIKSHHRCQGYTLQVIFQRKLLLDPGVKLLETCGRLLHALLPLSFFEQKEERKPPGPVRVPYLFE